MKKKIILSIFFINVFLLICSACSTKELTVDFSKNKYNDFIDTIIDAYSYKGKNAYIVEMKDDTAVLKIDGTKPKYVLFDLKNERVLSSDYNYRKKSNIRLLSFVDDNSQYDYTYDTFGNMTTIKGKNVDYEFNYNYENKVVSKIINQKMIENKIYKGNNIASIQYGNGDYVDYVRDENNYVTDVYSNDNLKYHMSYNQVGNLINYLDYDAERNYSYFYFDSNHLKRIIQNDFVVDYSDVDGVENISYSKDGNLGKSYRIDGNLYSSNYTYLIEKDLAERPVKINLKFDSFEYNTSYEYVDYEPTLSELTQENYEDYIYDISNDVKVSKYYNNGRIMEYDYNDDNLISMYKMNGIEYRYTYDEYNQLVSYSYGGDLSNIYYDKDGNLTKYNDIQVEYDAENLGRIKKYNGNVCEYDFIGNPIKYNNHYLKWNGRKLTSFDEYSYYYDKDGNRIKKINNDIEVDYYYDNNKLIYEQGNDYSIYYQYFNNEVIGIKYNGNQFYFVKNIQGDVVDILDGQGQSVVSYEYDPFGNVLNISGMLANTLGKNNPIRYRSYYFDNESSFYYVKTRCYDSSIGRFISPDDTIYLQGTSLLSNNSKNLYVYCLNDPINRVDSEGTSSREILNIIKLWFADLRVVSLDFLGPTMLVLNGANVYNAFHETAQVVAAEAFQRKGYSCELEVSCKKSNGTRGEIDLLLNGRYVYEIKNYFDSISNAKQQVNSYVNGNSYYLKGNIGFEEKKINFITDKIKMRVQYAGDGVILYSFSKELSFQFLWCNVQIKNEIKEEDLEHAIKVATWAGIAIAGTIILATIAEDVITYGAGVADDAPSVAAAASAYSGVVSGLVVCMI